VSETSLNEAGTGYQRWQVYLWVDSGERFDPAISVIEDIQQKKNKYAYA
jgi:hypothetical protein